MNFILDTCAVSETIKPKPDPGFMRWLQSQQAGQLFICTISLGELRKGMDRLPASQKKHDLLLWLIHLTTDYADRFLDFDTEAAFTRGALSAGMETLGKPLPVLDAIIAACALRHGCTLVTRNEDDYLRTGVPLLNPWDAKPWSSADSE
jgi:predicted nucleic acid-binding protein